MKYPTILSMALIAVLMVLAVSCTPLQGAQDGYEERPTSARRVILDDPYTTYLVRDPYTGMYYEVRPYGYSPYSSYYGSPYGYGYGSPYSNNRYYRDNGSGRVTENRQPSDNARKSRESVLGKH